MRRQLRSREGGSSGASDGYRRQGDGSGGADRLAIARAAPAGSGRDGGWRNAEAVADVEGDFGVGEESARGDPVAEEDRGGTAYGTG